MDREGANPLAGGRVFPVLPQPANTERATVLHGDGIGLFGLLSLDRLPFEEAIDRHDAPPPAIGVAEGGQTVDGLAFGVDRLAATLLSQCKRTPSAHGARWGDQNEPG